MAAILCSAIPARADEPRDLGTTEMCIDQAIAEKLAVKRRRRGAVDRLFVKQSRHEMSATGGYYASDLFSGTWVVGGSYTYHMTDQTAVEFGGGMTHANADVIRAIEDQRGEVLEDDFARVIYAESALLWSPVYGKLRLGGSIAHFDVHLDLPHRRPQPGLSPGAARRALPGERRLGDARFFAVPAVPQLTRSRHAQPSLSLRRRRRAAASPG
jgi:hypothetical protein